MNWRGWLGERELQIRPSAGETRLYCDNGKIPWAHRLNQTELYFPLTLDIQQQSVRAWLTIITPGSRLLVALSWLMLSWSQQQRDENEMNCTLSPKASLTKASHTDTPHFSGDGKCSPTMCLEGECVCSSATRQHLSLAKTCLLDGLEGKERTLISKSSCGQGQR